MSLKNIDKIDLSMFLFYVVFASKIKLKNILKKPVP